MLFGQKFGPDSLRGKKETASYIVVWQVGIEYGGAERPFPHFQMTAHYFQTTLYYFQSTHYFHTKLFSDNYITMSGTTYYFQTKLFPDNSLFPEFQTTKSYFQTLASMTHSVSPNWGGIIQSG